MRLLLATNHLGLGGSESYLLTVGEQFDRLGHDVAIYTPEPAGGVEAARERGIDVIGESGLGEDFDAALVQDGGVSYQLADLCPEVPQVFVAHSETFDLQAPPRLGGMVGAIVALNDRIAHRMRSFAVGTKVVRLRQPIDTERFVPRGALPEVPRRALLLSNTPHADRLSMLEGACAEAGLELSRLGGSAGSAADIRPALTAVEIVIGYGRSILEAMACGRAAYVYDRHGGEGWITADSYPEIEAGGIGGRSGQVILDPERLVHDLGCYRASMGPVNHDLVIAHHRANAHAEELLELIEGLADPPPRPSAPLQEMARLVRLEWRARLDVHNLVQENVQLRKLYEDSQQKLSEAQVDAKAETSEKVGETIRAYESTASWRLTRPLRALGRLRRPRLALSRAGRRSRSRADALGSDDTGAAR